MAITSLLQAIRAVGRALDDYASYQLTASTVFVSTSFSASDRTTGASTQRYNGAWIFSESTTQQRRVLTDSFVPSTGAWGINPQWDALPAVGSLVALTRLFPIIPLVTGEETPYREIINRAAAKILVSERFDIATIANSTEYFLSIGADRGWLDRPERLLKILEPNAIGARPFVPSDWRGWRLYHQLGLPTLELTVPFASGGDLFTLEVLRPADSRINGIEVASGVGMVNAADTCIAPLESLVLVSLMEAYQALMSRSPGRPSTWESKYEEARKRAEQLYEYDGGFYKPRSAAAAPTEVAA